MGFYWVLPSFSEFVCHCCGHCRSRRPPTEAIDVVRQLWNVRLVNETKERKKENDSRKHFYNGKVDPLHLDPW